MNFQKQLRSLCAPAHVYFIISIISILAMLSQNIMSDNIYTIGHVKSIMPVSNIITFAFKILYVLFWTYAINYVCKKGYTTFSWLLVFFPIVSMFVIIGLAVLLFAKDSVMKVASKI